MRKSFITVLDITPIPKLKDVKITFEYTQGLENEVTKYYKKPSTPELMESWYLI